MLLTSILSDSICIKSIGCKYFTIMKFESWTTLDFGELLVRRACEVNIFLEEQKVTTEVISLGKPKLYYTPSIWPGQRTNANGLSGKMYLIALQFFLWRIYLSDVHEKLNWVVISCFEHSETIKQVLHNMSEFYKLVWLLLVLVCVQECCQKLTSHASCKHLY